MKIKNMICLLMMAALIYLPACGSDDDEHDISYSPAQSSTADIIIQNNDNFWAIYDVYMTLSTISSWGSNVLPSGVILNPGGRYTFSVDPGTYDVKIGCGGAYRYSYDQVIKAGNTYTFTWTNPEG